eukprot:6085072-Amphidinium_carterae.2
MERPQKKPRKLRTGVDATDRPEDAEQEEEDDDDASDMTDGNGPTPEDEEDFAWDNNSFGFGSENEEQQEESSASAWQTPKRTFRQTLDAQPKYRARPTTPASTPAPQVPTELIKEIQTQDSRIAGLEAGLGRLESLMASMMQQTQQQQQQLLQEVQSVVQQNMAQLAGSTPAASQH